MKNIKFILLFYLIFVSIITKAQIKYPETKIKPAENKYHGIKIIDNYQWLENIRSDEVKKWVEQQNKISEKYLNKLVLSSESKRWMDKLSYHKMDYENIKDIDNNDKLYFSIMYSNIDSTPSIYYAKGINSSFERLINPNSISTKDQIVFTDLTPSKNGRFLAYQYSRNGSDWKEIKIVQIKKRHYFKEVLKHTISSEIYWLGQGFFYKKYPYDSTHGKRIFPKIMYHKLGTEQLDDKLIFDVKDQQESLKIYGTSKQNFYVIKKANQKYKKFSYYYLNPKNNNLKFDNMFENINYDINVIGFKLDTVIALTTIKGKKFIFSYPISNPKKWKILSPSYADAVFTDYEIMDNKIVISYQSKKSSIISVVNYNSKILGELITPEGLSVSNLTYSNSMNEFYFKLSSYTVPTCYL